MKRILLFIVLLTGIAIAGSIKTGNSNGTAGNFWLDDSASAVIGNARGVGAVDLQMGRNAATKVASGVGSFCVGTNNTVSGARSGAIGNGNTVTGTDAVAFGVSCSSDNYSISAGASCAASGGYAVAFGQLSTASGMYSQAMGFYAASTHFGQSALASGRFTINGDAQTSVMVSRRSISAAGTGGAGLTNTWCELFLDGDSQGYRMTLPSTNSVWTFKAQIVGKATTAGVNKAGGYTIEGVIKKITTTTSIVGSTTVVTLAEDDAAWDVRATADDTNDSLLLEVYSDVEPSRWVATVTLTQVMAP